MRIVLAAILICASLACAQDHPEPLPVDVVLSDMREAYAAAPTAEEVTARFRSGAGVRSDSFIVRIDPGSPPEPRPRAILLELGQLRIHIASGTLTAISTAAPDKYYQRSFEGSITAARLAELIPPVPLPQLSILNSQDPGFATPLIHLPRISWTSALVDQAARPLTLTLSGSGPSGSISITALISTVRLTRLSAIFRKADAESQLELTFRALDPGDPQTWSIPTDGRSRVQSLTDLRTTPKPLGAAAVGEPAPLLTLSRFDLSGWTLTDALDAAKPDPLAVILFRSPPDPARAGTVQKSAEAALAAVRDLRAEPGAPRVATAAAVVIELSRFSRNRWQALRETWQSLRAEGPELGADDLMWSPGALESIDRFAQGADAILVIIRSDRNLAAMINLDNRTQEQIAAELRKVLAP